MGLWASLGYLPLRGTTAAGLIHPNRFNWPDCKMVGYHSGILWNHCGWVGVGKGIIGACQRQGCDGSRVDFAALNELDENENENAVLCTVIK